MRLIDVDALREYFKVKERCEDCHYINECRDDKAEFTLGNICEAIDEQEIVDAIPVEWLAQQADNCREEMEFDVCEAIRTVIKEWGKEQEGDDATD